MDHVVLQGMGFSKGPWCDKPVEPVRLGEGIHHTVQVLGPAVRHVLHRASATTEIRFLLGLSRGVRSENGSGIAGEPLLGQAFPVAILLPPEGIH